MKVKQFHPDVNRDGDDSDTMIRRVIQAYQVPLFCFIHFRLKIFKFQFLIFSEGVS